MMNKFFATLCVCLMGLNATAAGNATDAAFDTLADLQRGVRNGYMNEMSPQEQRRFVGLLNQAADLLYGNSAGQEANFACISQGNGWFAVVDLNTNAKLGQNVGTLADCQKVLPPANRTYACVNQGNGWYAVYNILQKQKLGANVGTFGDCSKVVPENNAKLACVNQGNGWYALYNLQTNSKLGQNIGTFSDCQKAMPANFR